MKITRRQLRQIIKEELGRLTEAGEKLVTQGKFKGYVGRSGQKGYVVIGDHVYGPTAIDKIISWLSERLGEKLADGKYGGPPATTDSVKEALKHLKGMTVPDEHPVTGQLAGLSLTGETFAEEMTMKVMKALFTRKIGGAQPEKKSVNESMSRTLFENDPFADLDAAVAKSNKPEDTSNYPANEAEAKSTVKTMMDEMDKEKDEFKKLDIGIKYGLSKQNNDDFTFKKKGGGTITVTVPGYRK